MRDEARSGTSVHRGLERAKLAGLIHGIKADVYSSPRTYCGRFIVVLDGDYPLVTCLQCIALMGG